MKKLITLIIIFTIASGYAFSQDDLYSKLQKVGNIYGSKYLEPFSKGFGSNLNSGWLGGLKIASYSKLPVTLSLYGGVKFSGMVLTEDDQYFDLTYSDKYNYNGNIVDATFKVTHAPTVFGSTAPAVADVYVGNTKVATQQIIGGVVDSKFVPLFIPQIGFGSVLGTDVTARILPRVDMGNYGKVMFTGFAIRHNISNYIKGMPFDLAVQGGYQKFSVNNSSDVEIISANSYMVNIQAAKTILLITLYGAIQYENFGVDINYSQYIPQVGNINIAFSQKGNDNFRGILGASLNLPGFTVNADFNMARNFMFSAGVGASF